MKTKSRDSNVSMDNNDRINREQEIDFDDDQNNSEVVKT